MLIPARGDTGGPRATGRVRFARALHTHTHTHTTEIELELINRRRRRRDGVRIARATKLWRRGARSRFAAVGRGNLGGKIEGGACRLCGARAIAGAEPGRPPVRIGTVGRAVRA